jgi:hypothetical protein
MNMKTKSLTVLLSLLACSSVHADTPPVDLQQAAAEVSRCYTNAHPEVQEFVLHTARSFGSSGLWLNEGAYAPQTEQREARIVYLAKLFSDAEYGRLQCAALAEAGALKDPRFVPGLMKVAAYHVDDVDYDVLPNGWPSPRSRDRNRRTPPAARQPGGSRQPEHASVGPGRARARGQGRFQGG